MDQRDKNKNEALVNAWDNYLSKIGKRPAMKFFPIIPDIVNNLQNLKIFIGKQMDNELREYLQEWLINQGEDEEFVYALSDSTLLFCAKEKGLRLYDNLKVGEDE